MGIRIEVAAHDVADVGRHHADAVGVVALEIRQYEVLGGLLGKGVLGPGASEDACDEAAKPFCID